MNKFDLLNKEFIESFYYDTINECRDDEKTFVSLGREYSKYGEYQPVFLAGVLHSVENRETHEKSKLLLVGLAKCAIDDLCPDKDKYYSEAESNAYSCPVAMIQDINDIYDFDFDDIASVIARTTKLDFMMTPEEVNVDREFVDHYCDCGCNCGCDDCKCC